MKRTSSLYACLALALALSVGCKKEEAPPAESPAPAAKSHPSPASKPPVQGAVTSASASAAGPLDFRKRKDPFKAPAAVLPPAAPGAVAQKARPAEDLLPIQSFETSKFTVAGIIAGITENRALVIDPSGKGYVVQKGMLIGNNDGRVSRITSNSVEVVERYREDTGRTRQRTIVLTLTKKREGASR
jgi:type IV pilus assembly protein PilP